MSIANAAHHSMIGGGNANIAIKSLRQTGTTAEPFYYNGIGTITLPKTITLWYKFAAYPQSQVWGDRVVVKLGDSTTGAGYGFLTYPGINALRAMLIEGKYWVYFKSETSWQYTDTSWHHLAIVFKSGTYPARGTVYIDGVAYESGSGMTSTAMNSPKGNLCFCGRSASVQDTDLLVCKPSIFNGQFTATDVADDIALGAQKSSSPNLEHFWNGDVQADKVVDQTGSWDLIIGAGASISVETPWS